MPFNKTSLPILIATMVGAILVVTMVVRIERARTVELAHRHCVENLRAIDSAKRQWALWTIAKTNKVRWYSSEDADDIINGNAIKDVVPTWNDVLPYLQTIPDVWQKGGMPLCPLHGTYSLGRVAEVPSCSVSVHVLD